MERLRWDILILMVVLGIGNWWMIYYPMILEIPIMEVFQVNSLKIGYLFSAYGVPNLILLPFLGIISSKYGISLSSLILNSTIYGSCLLSSIAIYTSNFSLLLFAKLLHGIGGEFLVVVPSIVAEKYFSGRLLSFSIGISQFISQISLAGEYFVLPILLASSRTIFHPFFFIGISCFISWLANLLLYVVDNKKDSNPAHSVKLDTLLTGDQQGLENRSEDSRFTISDLQYLSVKYWLVVIIFVLISGAYYQFVNYSTDLLVSRFGYEYTEAKNIGGFMLIVCAVLIPILSAFVTRYGKKASILTLASLLATATFFTMMKLPKDPSWIASLCCYSISAFYSLYSSCIWSSMTLLVPPQASSTGLSTALTLQNLLFLILPILFGFLLSSSTEPQNAVFWLFSILSLLSLAFSIILLFIDLRGSRTMEMSENSKEMIEFRERLRQEFEGFKRNKQTHN